MYIPDWEDFPELTLEEAQAYQDFVTDFLAAAQAEGLVEAD